MAKFLSTQEANNYLKEEIESAINFFKSELSSIRVGRANPRILDKVMVNYYGNPTPLNQMANISVPDAKMLVISLWDANMLKEVVKAINEANLGLNPSDDGKVIRLVFPDLTQERRKEVAKTTRTLCENAKIAVRNIRRNVIDELKDMKKANILTEDEMNSAEKEVQKIVDNSTQSIDNITADKEKEIMSI